MRRSLQSLKLLTCLALSLLCACVREDDQSAPVVNGWNYAQSHSPTYIVRPGDTLYSIAWAFGLDYRSLALNNDLQTPYHINSGQKLNMVIAPNLRPRPTSPVIEHPTQQHVVVSAHRVSESSLNKTPTRLAVQKSNFNAPITRWIMPARGRIVKGFSALSWGNKGINVSGIYGESVVASAPGEVVYAGAGIRGYGNLIILKHNDSFLSAYAYNKVNLVKEGAWVRQGQPIATMGKTDAGNVLLHFEIRRNGQAVNPLVYLK